MLLIRLSSLVLLFITTTSIISINHSLQDSNVDTGLQGVSIEKVGWQKLCVKTGAQMKFQGRKTMNDNVMKSGGVSEKFESSESSKFSNEATWERAGRGFQCVEKVKNGRKLVSEDDAVSSFVAFNADYRGPRHHPPRNN